MVVEACMGGEWVTLTLSNRQRALDAATREYDEVACSLKGHVRLYLLHPVF